MVCYDFESSECIIWNRVACFWCIYMCLSVFSFIQSTNNYEIDRNHTGKFFSIKKRLNSKQKFGVQFIFCFFCYCNSAIRKSLFEICLLVFRCLFRAVLISIKIALRFRFLIEFISIDCLFQRLAVVQFSIGFTA